MEGAWRPFCQFSQHFREIGVSALGEPHLHGTNFKYPGATPWRLFDAFLLYFEAGSRNILPALLSIDILGGNTGVL